MIRIFKVVFVFALCLSFAACPDDIPVAEKYTVPYAEQYPKDLLAIETFLKTHTITTINNVGLSEDQDVTFAPVPAGDANSIWGSGAVHKTSLLERNVTKNDVNYKVYYISLREGTKKKPTCVDSLYVSYKGAYIYTKKEEVVPATNPVTYKSSISSNDFDQAQNPVWFSLDNVIFGWKEIMTLFKSGTNTTNSNGTVKYEDFGAGVMFLPSGLAYYNGSIGSIPAYSPLIFSFKLQEVNYADTDYDRIDSKDEGYNPLTNTYTQDTDGDGRLDYIDQDDDGDGFLTKYEIKKPTPFLGNSLYYPFDVIADNPATTINESEPKGIPSSSGDGVTTTRVRRHLDKNSRPPFTTY